MSEPQLKVEESMREILNKLNEIDDGIIAIDVEALKQLSTKMKVKVDSYKGILDAIKVRMATLKHQEDELKSIRESLKKKAENLAGFLAFHMKQNGFSRLPGEKYQVSLVTKDTVLWDENMAEPDALMFQKHKGFVNRKYSWDKSAITTDLMLKREESEFKNLGKVVPKSHVSFTVKKGIQNDI